LWLLVVAPAVQMAAVVVVLVDLEPEQAHLLLLEPNTRLPLVLEALPKQAQLTEVREGRHLLLAGHLHLRLQVLGLYLRVAGVVVEMAPLQMVKTVVQVAVEQFQPVQAPEEQAILHPQAQAKVVMEAITPHLLTMVLAAVAALVQSEQMEQHLHLAVAALEPHLVFLALL
jgi:hypothetical protein